MDRRRVVGPGTAARPAKGRRVPLGSDGEPEGDAPARPCRTGDGRPAGEGAAPDDPEVVGIAANVHEDALDSGSLGRRCPMPVDRDRSSDGAGADRSGGLRRRGPGTCPSA